MAGIFDKADCLHKGLDAAWLRNAVISNNIANVETPGFKSSRVNFETVFKQALEGGGFQAKMTRAGHRDFGDPDVSAVAAQVAENNATTMRMDGNNVDIDYENAELAKNYLYYNTLSEMLMSEYRKIDMAINEGK